VLFFDQMSNNEHDLMVVHGDSAAVTTVATGVSGFSFGNPSGIESIDYALPGPNPWFDSATKQKTVFAVGDANASAKTPMKPSLTLAAFSGGSAVTVGTNVTLTPLPRVIAGNLLFLANQESLFGTASLLSTPVAKPAAGTTLADNVHSYAFSPDSS